MSTRCPAKTDQVNTWSVNCSWTGRSSTSMSTRCPTETVSLNVNSLSCQDQSSQHPQTKGDRQPKTPVLLGSSISMPTRNPAETNQVNIWSVKHSRTKRPSTLMSTRRPAVIVNLNVNSRSCQDRSGQHLQPEGDRQPMTPNVSSLLCQKSTYASILIGDPAVYWQPISNDEVTRATRRYPLILLHLNY